MQTIFFPGRKNLNFGWIDLKSSITVFLLKFHKISVQIPPVILWIVLQKTMNRSPVIAFLIHFLPTSIGIGRFRLKTFLFIAGILPQLNFYAQPTEIRLPVKYSAARFFLRTIPLHPYFLSAFIHLLYHLLYLLHYLFHVDNCIFFVITTQYSSWGYASRCKAVCRSPPDTRKTVFTNLDIPRSALNVMEGVLVELRMFLSQCVDQSLPAIVQQDS